MKKIFKVLILLSFMILGLFLFTGCNKQIIDTNYTFNKAIINTGSESITINVKSWKDYDGEQIQIVSTDGKVYLVSSFNTILIKE